MTDDRVRGQNGRHLQRTRVQPGGWTLAKRKLFLDTLAATCNVTTAARAAGMEAHSAYAMRRREPAFSDLWEEALETGYHRLEEELLQRSLGALEGLVIDPDASPAPGLPPLDRATAAPAAPGRGDRVVGAGRGLPVEYQLALAVLARREAAKTKGPFRGSRARMGTEEVNALLIRKLDALYRRTRTQGAADGAVGASPDAAPDRPATAEDA